MEEKNSILDKVINFFFGLAILICCIGMLYALIVFVRNCDYLRFSTNRLIENYSSVLGSENELYPQTFYESETNDIFEENSTIKFNQASYIENLIDYVIKLQQLEANAVSTNILTFLYTFLSGTLIGVATYFVKKNYASIKQIRENRELLTNLERRTLFANLYIYAQRTHLTMQVFSASLDTIQDINILSESIDKYVPSLNDLINEMLLLFNNRKESIKILNDEERARLINEIYGIGSLIDTLRVPQSVHTLITSDQNDMTKTMWKEQLNNIRKIIK